MSLFRKRINTILRVLTPAFISFILLFLFFSLPKNPWIVFSCSPKDVTLNRFSGEISCTSDIIFFDSKDNPNFEITNCLPVILNLDDKKMYVEARDLKIQWKNISTPKGLSYCTAIYFNKPVSFQSLDIENGHIKLIKTVNTINSRDFDFTKIGNDSVSISVPGDNVIIRGQAPNNFYAYYKNEFIGDMSGDSVLNIEAYDKQPILFDGYINPLRLFLNKNLNGNICAEGHCSSFSIISGDIGQLLLTIAGKISNYQIPLIRTVAEATEEGLSTSLWFNEKQDKLTISGKVKSISLNGSSLLLTFWGWLTNNILVVVATVLSVYLGFLVKKTIEKDEPTY